jgi:hypothetical protein
MRRKGAFLADSLDSGMMHLHKVGLASHIRHGNFGENPIPLRGRREGRTLMF